MLLFRLAFSWRLIRSRQNAEIGFKQTGDSLHDTRSSENTTCQNRFFLRCDKIYMHLCQTAIYPSLCGREGVSLYLNNDDDD